MKIRKGFVQIAVKRLKKGDVVWLWRQAVKRRRIRQALRSSGKTALCGPVIAHIFCTRRCNLNCPMCDIPSRAGRELDTARLIGLIDELAALGTSGVSFTGGEPLLRDDIFTCIRHSRSRRMETILVTNGIEMERLADAIVDAGPDVINVSVDGSCAPIHDRSRGKDGAFEKMRAGVTAVVRRARAKRARIQFVASCVISQNNIDDLDNIITLCSELGFDRIIFCPLHEFGSEKSTVRRIECGYDLQEFLVNHPKRSLIDNSDRYLRHLNAVARGELPPAGCRAGHTTVIIDHEGTVYPCKCRFECGRPLVAPQAARRTLADIWYSEEYDAFRRECGECRDCYLTANREFDGLFI